MIFFKVNKGIYENFLFGFSIVKEDMSSVSFVYMDVLCDILRSFMLN